MQIVSPPPDLENHVIVCGLGRFGLRIVDHLRSQNIPVVVITENSRDDRKLRVLESGCYIVNNNFLFPEARTAARIESARALILATSNDAANLEAALDARNENPAMRIVMRIDSDKVAVRLCNDFQIDAALSPPVLAAPAFTHAALEPPAPVRQATHSPITTPTRRLTPRRLTRSAIPGVLVSCLFALFLVAVMVFRTALNLTWTDAIYFTATIVTTVGFGDYNLKDQSANVKLFGAILMFSGVILIAVVSSLLTNFFLSGAANQLRAERLASRYKNHVILCGLGSVGFEVAEDIIAQGVRLVIVDKTPEDALARNLSARVPLIVGDATDPAVLLRAGVDRARAVISAVSNDAVNLEIGFITQTLVQERRPNRPLRIVLRCFDATLAHRIHARSNAYTLLSSAEIAAPLFVAEALK